MRCLQWFVPFVLTGPFAAWAQVATTRAAKTPPPRLGVVGLVHGHVWGFFENVRTRGDVEVVGIADPSEELRRRYGIGRGYPASILFADTAEMLEKTRPDAVVAFTDTFDHRAVVEACARRGVHVMMEKPLAVSLEHARAIERAAREGRIHVLVNYETTWYPNTLAAYDVVKRKNALGEIRKIVVHDGHQGPKEIGMPREFLDWLTDPKRNGDGALFDFGCYGANLVTWLMDGQRPRTVTAVTQRIKTDATYARVDDEATILLTYPHAQAVIQASWNWPIGRKDMEIYGQRGQYVTVDRDAYRLRTSDGKEMRVQAPPVPAPNDDPISYLCAVVRGEVAPADLSSLRLNVIVTEILDAARRSAETGRTIPLDDAPPAP